MDTNLPVPWLLGCDCRHQRLLTGFSRVLSAFSQLKYLDLSPTSLDTYGVGRADHSDEYGICKEWSKACPTLERITFPSQVEWVSSDHDDSMEGGIGGSGVGSTQWKLSTGPAGEDGLSSGSSSPMRI